MQKQVYKVDEYGCYVGPVIIENKDELPNDCIDVQPPQGLYRARWTGEEWAEEGTPPEPQPKPPTLEERLEALELLELERLFGGI